MEKEPTKIRHSIAIKRSIRGFLAIASIYLSSCAPISPSPPMPESDLRNPQAMAAFGTINFPPSPEIETPTLSGPEPDPELKTEDDPNILEVPGVGRFRRTNIILEGEASTYSREGCLGCRPDRIMANGKKLEDGDTTLAVPPDGEFPLNSYVLVENITEADDNEPNEIPQVVAKATDTGWFKRDLGRIADLTLTTNHFILGGVRGGGLRPLQVRLTLLEAIELTTDNS